MRSYRDQGVVLRTHKLAEADRIISLLTRDNGLVRAVAKGVRRTSSRIGARLEPFMQVDLLLHPGRQLAVVSQVETIAAFGAVICRDYQLYTAATAMVEAAEKLTEIEAEPARPQYRLVVGALRALASRAHAPGLVLDAFLLRSLAVAGYAPRFDACARCGGLARAFAPSAGGAVCTDCRPPGAAAPAAETFCLLGALLAGDWPVAEASSQPSRREAAGLVAAYVQWHIERRMRSLALVERDS